MPILAVVVIDELLAAFAEGVQAGILADHRRRPRGRGEQRDSADAVGAGGGEGGDANVAHIVLQAAGRPEVDLRVLREGGI